MMIKKVGLVTWNGSYNYGTNLQAYALYHTVLSMGYDTYMLSYFSVEDHTIVGFIKSVYLKWKYRLKKNAPPSVYGKNPIKMKRVEDFVNQHFEYSKPQKSNRSFQKSLHDTDCLITGSDQIWNPYYLQTFYLLPTIGLSIRKVSYASSIGVNEIPLKMQSVYQKTLSSFNHLSLREKTGATLVKSLTGKDVTTVLDPTMLLTEQDWNQLAFKAEIGEMTSNAPYILCYFVGENATVWDDIKNIQRKTGIQKVIVIPLEASHYQTDFTLFETAGPCEFVRLLRDAELVCTDSYHATTLSLILKKNFIEFLRFQRQDPQSQNSRIFELLTHYGLQDRFFETGQEASFEAIDFDRIHALLETDRLASMEYLKKALS